MRQRALIVGGSLGGLLGAVTLQRTDLPLKRRPREWEVLQLHAGLAMTRLGRQMGDRIMGLDASAA